MESSSQKQQLANAVISKMTQIQEELVEREIEKYDTAILQHDASAALPGSDDTTNDDTTDPTVQQWRQKRILEYQRQQDEMTKCRQTFGHGEYMELQQQHNGGGTNTIDVATAFFDVCKDSTRVVLHCYRPTTELCTIFHKHLQLLAPKHVETRFVKLNVQDYDDVDNNNTKQRGTNGNIGMKFLVERLQIRVMPTLILIQQQQIVHRIEGCTELNNTTAFTTNMLAYVLGHKYKMTHPTPDEVPDQVLNGNRTNVGRSKNSNYVTGGTKGSTRYRYSNNDKNDDDEEDYEDN